MDFGENSIHSGVPQIRDRDMGGDSHEVDVGDEEEDLEEVEFLPRITRKGERKAMYLSRRDFA